MSDQQPTVWVLAHVKDPAAGGWDLGGIFTSREKALAACAHPEDGIWEETLDKAYSREVDEPARTFYPLAEPERQWRQ